MKFYLAQPSPTPWNIKANSLDDGGVLVNLTGDPASHDTNFYIISMNKTELNQHDYGDHHDDRNKPARYLHMANSSDILAIVSGIPVYSEFEAVVYRVDTTHDIHKSEIFSFETAEGGEYISLYTNLFYKAVSLTDWKQPNSRIWLAEIYIGDGGVGVSN